MRNVFIESGFVSYNKFGEELCGDRVMTYSDEEVSTIVLSDGLGSGVKANILSTLTAKIIGTMMAEKMPIEDCVSTIAQTLPVCKVRQVAYSTFTILQVHKNGDAYLVQYDNPKAILLRGGKSYDYAVTEKVINGKTILETNLKVQTGDMFVLMSDGAIHAGVGMALNFGWQRDNIAEYAESRFDGKMSAKSMAATVGQACLDLYMEQPGDDTTIAALKIKERNVVNLMIGPPSDKADDEKILQLFFSKEGKRIVCGGTTSQMVSRFLDEPIKTEINYIDPKIPPIAHIEGVDLVTEGVITIGRVLDLANGFWSVANASIDWKTGKDGASKIAQVLFEEATDINFFVGKAINPSHQNPDLPISINIKMQLIEGLAARLREMGKNVKVNIY